MNIALVSAEYPPETDFGGLGSYTYKLAHALSALGSRVTVVSSSVKGDAVTAHPDGPVMVYRVPKPRQWLMGLDRSVGDIVYSYRVHRVLERLIQQDGLDVIQFPEYRGEGLAHCFLGHTPYVVRFSTPRWLVNELNRTRRAGPRTLINHAIDRWVENTPARRGRALIFPSRDLMNLMTGRIRLRGACRVVYPGIDTERFKPCQDPNLRRRYGIGDGPVILYVGRLELRKGVHVLAEAAVGIAQRFPAARFVFAGGDTKSAPGGGSMRAYLERLVRQHGIEHAVTFLGGVGHQDVATIYGLGDILVVPSIYENLANVLIEGMAAGLPIVTTSGGGSPEVVTHGTNGLVVPPGNAKALADAISDLLADPQVRDCYGQNNRKKALEDLSLERMARETLAVYSDLLTARKR
jgi:glycosyltransferase involved in cell wall biosynthesis